MSLNPKRFLEIILAVIIGDYILLLKTAYFIRDFLSYTIFFLLIYDIFRYMIIRLIE